MRSARPSEEQLRRNFDSVLSEVSAGRGVRTETGLDEQTENALWAIARAAPNIAPELVDAARAAFAGQLDGSNAVARRAEFDRKLAERAARNQR
ncbi:hypothetical protein [Nocardia sp. NPDC005978]|uniref:hypothetical protein n=1 Tax=unclassified Nocardia TaxID=2637762 RepID=UPI0033B366A9